MEQAAPAPDQLDFFDDDMEVVQPALMLMEVLSLGTVKTREFDDLVAFFAADGSASSDLTFTPAHSMILLIGLAQLHATTLSGLVVIEHETGKNLSADLAERARALMTRVYASADLDIAGLPGLLADARIAAEALTDRMWQRKGVGQTAGMRA